MTDQILYSHRETGRGPGTIFALLIFVALTAFCWLHEAPWFFYPILVFGLYGLGSMVVLNPASGMDLTATELRAYSGSWSATWPVSEIDRFALIEWSEGAPSGRVHDRAGNSVAIPSVCMDRHPALLAALERLAIPVERR